MTDPAPPQPTKETGNREKITVGERYTVMSEPEPTHSLTRLEFEVLCGGEHQSLEDNLWILCLGLVLSGIMGLIGVYSSADLEVDNKPNWDAIWSVVILWSLIGASLVGGIFCFVRSWRSKRGQIYRDVRDRIAKAFGRADAPPPASPAR